MWSEWKTSKWQDEIAKSTLIEAMVDLAGLKSELSNSDNFRLNKFVIKTISKISNNIQIEYLVVTTRWVPVQLGVTF